MSLSFEESLKNSNEEMLATASFEQEDIAEEPVSIMAFSMRDVPMLLADNEGWQKSTNVNYRYYTADGYSDEEYSIIDKNKNIILNQNQINITQESNSQYIPFQMPRRYDGFDLTNTTIRIYYVNRDKLYGWQYPVDVYYNDDTIKFAWLVGKDATAKSGELKFEIQAIGTNSKGEDYVWKSRSIAQLNVIQSLEEIAVGEIGLTQDQAQSLYNAIEQLSTQTTIAAKEANDLLTETKELVNELKDGITQEVIDAIDTEIKPVLGDTVESAVSDKMKNYYTKDNTYSKEEVDTAITGVNNKFGVLGTKEDGTTSKTVVEFVADKIGDLGEIETVVGYITEALKDVDISAALGDIGTKEVDGVTVANTVADFVLGKIGDLGTYKNDIGEDVSIETVVEYVTEALKDVNIDSKLGTLKVGETTYDTVAEFVKAAVDSVDVSGQLSDCVTKNDLAGVTSDVAANTTNLTALGSLVAGLQTDVNAIDKSARKTYDIVYNDESDENGGKNVLVLYEIENEGKEDQVKSPKRIYTIEGGNGGISTQNKLYIYYDKNEEGKEITKYIFTKQSFEKNEAKIRFDFDGKDNTDSPIPNANGEWSLRLGSSGKYTTIKKGVILHPGYDIEFNISEYIKNPGTYSLKLEATDDTKGFATKVWEIQVVELLLTSEFDDTYTRPAGTEISFDYTPIGAIEKDIYFEINGDVFATVKTKASNVPNPVAVSIPAKEHGTYLVKAYITANINGTIIPSDPLFKDVMFCDPANSAPLISCSTQDISMMQYDTFNLNFSVFDPSTESPKIQIIDNGKVLITETMSDGSTGSYRYKAMDVFEDGETEHTHLVIIKCGDTEKEINIKVEKINVDISPVTKDLVFDFNPIGYSNNMTDTERIWSYGDIKMTVSENFDWVNGGYQTDSNGDQFFCIKAGTTAVINYKLFEKDPKINGKEFKLIFKTTNVSNPYTTFLSCIDGEYESDYIGIRMDAHEAYIYGHSNERLRLPYSEEDIIEFEFNINKSSDPVPMIMGYEDGVSTCPWVYGDSVLKQTTPAELTLGSDDCDLHIYRFKVYDSALTDVGILNNFIADARSSEEMISRYNRNQIKDDYGNLNPDILAQKCPWLRIIKIEAPNFTTDKDDKVRGTTIQHIYKNGDPVLDNWTAYDCVHSGQGTSSNDYGQAGRNLDLIIQTYKNYGNDPYIILGDGTRTDKVSLTRTSVPANYFNCKVNIASSENANNALLQKRFNDYNPHKRNFIREEGYDTSIIKDTMEFHNCVIFIKETKVDESGNCVDHSEFNDTDWHFYAIGNIGDSKKTDKTRLTDPLDRYECINEIIDVGKPLSDFPSGDTAISNLEAEKFDKSGTYEWRYIWKDGTSKENEEVFNYCKQKWIDFYKFVINSTDEEFKARLGDYFVLESALYYYLFTTRYTMVDNRAKNSFWHYGKTGEVDSDGNPIRKWDLSFDYDNDTALGINNHGQMVYRYGYEDTDVDEKGVEVFRESDSTFFCRIRDLFKDELKDMYNDLDSLKAWSADGLISQFDTWQSEFPEELWRTDIERKYIRTYTTSHINGGAFTDALKNMAHGKKKYQRREYERSQEKYMASKYQSSTSRDDNVFLRCAKTENLPDNLAVKPNYSFKIKPYAHMYLNVMYGNGSEPISLRVSPREEPYTIPPLDTGIEIKEAEIINIYSASSLSSIGDLSPFYLNEISISTAKKIKELTLGSDYVNGENAYDNPYLTSITFSDNNLLENINIENVSGLTSSLDLRTLKNLKSLYAKGSNISGVSFANGGRLEIAELPAISSLNMRNLIYLTKLDVDFSKLLSLRVENCDSVDLIDVLNKANKLKYIRITDIDWTLDDTTLLDRLYKLDGIDHTEESKFTDQSVLSGRVYVPTIKERQLAAFREAWPDLKIEHSPTGLIPQYEIKFINQDGSPVLDETGAQLVQYVALNEFAADPSIRDDAGKPKFPTIPSSVKYDFEFDKWVDINGDEFNFSAPIKAPATIKALYKQKLRKYNIKYVTKTGTVLLSGDYGTNVPYNFDLHGIPVYTGEEGNDTFYLFSHWDKSGFLLEGIDGTDLSGGEDGQTKIVNAIYDKFHYTDMGTGIIELNEDISTKGSFTEGNFKGVELIDLTPVQLYALTKLGAETVPFGQYDAEFNRYEGLTVKDVCNINIGNDVDFSDIESNTYIDENTKFNGTNTHIDTGDKLFDTEKDFVLAIDYKFYGSKAGTLIQCMDQSSGRGFKLSYNGSKVQFTYDGVTKDITTSNKREMIVIRNAKNEDTGEYALTIYNSDMDELNIIDYTLNRRIMSDTNANLIVGASFSYGEYSNYVDGEINWLKYWDKDLGNTTCSSLALWPHESVEMQVCGFKRYIVENNKKCSFNLIATHLLDRVKQWNSSGSNDGGWDGSTLNNYLNDRLYKALPIQIRSLIKPVFIISNDGRDNTKSPHYQGMSKSLCYITVPALVELSSSYQDKEPYSLEIDNGDDDITKKTISFFKENEDRIMKFKNGVANAYWTRTPDVTFTNYVFRITDQGTIASTTGSRPDATNGVLIEISL